MTGRALTEFLSGSPPHTWRIHEKAKNDNRKLRITSTHVENTYLSRAGMHRSEDHLHTRGEYAPVRIKYFQSSGITSTHVENTNC